MDLLSVAGLAVGVVSLAFELFSACIKGKTSRFQWFLRRARDYLETGLDEAEHA